MTNQRTVHRSLDQSEASVYLSKEVAKVISGMKCDPRHVIHQNQTRAETKELLPIRGKYSGHVISIGQSEASIHLMSISAKSEVSIPWKLCFSKSRPELQ